VPDVGTRELVLYVDDIDFSDSVKVAEVVGKASESEFLSYAEALAGGARAYDLHLVLKQNTSADSLWDYIWSHAGEDVAVELWPNGYNSGTQSTSYPQFTGTVTILEPDGTLLGGEAKVSNRSKQTTEVTWPFLAKPTRVTAPA
jgi:hypothetical protein